MSLAVRNTTSTHNNALNRPLSALTSFHGNRLSGNSSGSSCSNLLQCATPSVLFNLQQAARSAASPLASSNTSDGGNGSRLHLQNLLASSVSVYGGGVDVDDVDDEDSGIYYIIIICCL